MMAEQSNVDVDTEVQLKRIKHTNVVKQFSIGVGTIAVGSICIYIIQVISNKSIDLNQSIENISRRGKDILDVVQVDETLRSIDEIPVRIQSLQRVYNGFDKPELPYSAAAEFRKTAEFKNMEGMLKKVVTDLERKFKSTFNLLDYIDVELLFQFVQYKGSDSELPKDVTIEQVGSLNMQRILYYKPDLLGISMPHYGLGFKGYISRWIEFDSVQTSQTVWQVFLDKVPSEDLYKKIPIRNDLREILKPLLQACSETFHDYMKYISLDSGCKKYEKYLTLSADWSIPEQIYNKASKNLSRFHDVYEKNISSQGMNVVCHMKNRLTHITDNKIAKEVELIGLIPWLNLIIEDVLELYVLIQCIKKKVNEVESTQV